jgi:hypothetical protein
VLRFVDDGDHYWTSMLLVDGFLAQFSARVGARPVAFVPDRDTLIVTADDPATLPGVYQAVEQDYLRAPRQVSPVAYTVDDRGGVRPYAAPPGSPLAAIARRAELILAGQEYAAQKEALDAARERDGGEYVFLAQLMVLEQPGSPAFSVAVWVQDLDTLLPQADFIGFQATDGDAVGQPFTVPFDVVAREGLLVPEPGLTPPRFRATGWPDAATLARLRAGGIRS